MMGGAGRREKAKKVKIGIRGDSGSFVLNGF